MTRTLPDALLVAKGEQIVVERHDAPLRIRDRALTVADELGPKQILEHPAPRPIDVLVSLAAALFALAVVLLGIGMTLFILGGVR